MWYVNLEMNGSTSGSNSSNFTSAESHVGIVNASHPEDNGKTNANETEPNIKLLKISHNSSEDIGSVRTSDTENATSTGRRLLEESNPKGSQEDHSQSKDNNTVDAQAANVQNDESLEAEADASFELFRENEELGDEYSYDYDDYVDESMWGDEEWTEGQHETMEDYVNIDSHILCTPVSFCSLWLRFCSLWLHVYSLYAL